jgi:pilus assembly protein Flp/PilA
MKKMMESALLRLYVETRALAEKLTAEDGQDLVEYALVIAVVCLGIISGMSTLAGGINNAMTTLTTSLNAAVA